VQPVKNVTGRYRRGTVFSVVVASASPASELTEYRGTVPRTMAIIPYGTKGLRRTVGEVAGITVIGTRSP
jgi:hypothetical protein